MGKCDWDEVVVPEKHCNWVGVTDDSNSGWTIPPIDFEDDDDGDDDDIDGEEGGDSEGVPPWYCVEYAGTDGAGYKQCENPPGDGVIVDGPFADLITCIEK